MNSLILERREQIPVSLGSLEPNGEDIEREEQYLTPRETIWLQ